jgi:hypothetical protein
MFGTIQNTPAQPVCMYTSTSARCWCGATIKLRTDGLWTHASAPTSLYPRPLYCRERTA